MIITCRDVRDVRRDVLRRVCCKNRDGYGESVQREQDCFEAEIKLSSYLAN